MKSPQPLEQNVYNDVFPQLIEKVFFDMRKIPPPPLPGSTEEENDSLLRDYKNYLDETKFKKLHVIVEDSVDGLPKRELVQLSKSKDLKFIDTSQVKGFIKIDLSKIDLGENYNLFYKSEINTPIKKLRLNELNKQAHLREYSGEISFSRIYFNSQKTKGFFYSFFYCGSLCGQTYKVLVVKKGNKWFVDRVISDGIS